MAIKGLYRGFSTFEYQKSKTFKLTDVDLVKMDILNHIFTRRGSRVMMPNFGTLIPSLVFEPLDRETIETVEEELRYVFDYDPRVQLLELRLLPDYDNNALTASARILYIELQQVDQFDLNIQFEE